MPIWITRFDSADSASSGRVRVAVKDAIDIAGTVTSAGCVAVRDRAAPATADAPLLAGVRAAGALIAGKTTMTELGISPAGDNAEFGTPVNPAAPDRIPGGSSSGSAVAVATDQADVGLGTDTGGSVRIPAACCAIVGLKTTWGRVPAEGVWPLARTLDTVGPLARDVAGVVTGMTLLEPGFTIAPRPARVAGRLRIDGVDPEAERVVDAALQAAGLTVREVRLPGWEDTYEALDAIILGELWEAHHALLDVEGVGAFVNSALHAGRTVSERRLARAMAARARWQAEVAAAFGEADVLALPTLVSAPPPLTDFAGSPLTRLTAPFNLAGVPAIAMPIPSPGFAVPVSLQLAGPMGSEDLLCATALTIEEAWSAGTDPAA